MKVLVEVSARHVHLSQNVIDKIFGFGYNLKIKRMLSQTDQFLSEEKVNICVGPFCLENVSILGPARSETQIEISLTDARKLKIKVPIRESGNLIDTPGCKIIGHDGFYEIPNGIIVSKRHVHMSPDDAFQHKFRNGQECILNITTKDRTLSFGKTVVRVDKNFKLAAHIDTDESNAAGIQGQIFGEIYKNLEIL
ncbi:MAG: PduL/EutD family phosphate acyltransferase, partial [Firmicutes bacterium]|nr:PduL/EutD family phosphate acyltransferase [Bacillota bacterium]